MTPSKQGHSLERYQMLQMLRPYNTITAGDLTDAGGTSLGKFRIPPSWGTVYVVAMGFHHEAAGGAQTTAGKMQLEIAGSDVLDEDSAAFTAASVASHAAGSSVETELLQNATDVTNLAAPPQYPTLTSEQLAELKVDTQGVGAGDQTISPYLIVKLKPAVT